MSAEIVKPELAQVSVETVGEKTIRLSHEKKSCTMQQGNGLIEAIQFGSHCIVRPETKTEISNLEPRDAVDEWPAPMQIHSFYYVKYRSYDEPKLKVKLEHADKERQKLSQARAQIVEKLKAKKSEMGPLQLALGKFRAIGSTNQLNGGILCSSEEELNNLIKSLDYRIQHEIIPLSEEKKLLREIRQLEGTREKVIANDAMRASIQDSMAKKDATEDQVYVIGVDPNGIKKEQQVVKAKLKQLGKEITALEAELNAITEKKDKAYGMFKELKQQIYEGNACYYKNCDSRNKARQLAVKKNIEALKEICSVEVEEFMSLWNSNKTFRYDYQQRILASLSRDGRKRTPDDKLLASQEAPILSEPIIIPKTDGEKPKDEKIYVFKKELKNEVQKEAKEKITVSGTSLETQAEVQEVLKSKPKEIDEVKLKEMKREEEIAKAKLAMERKRKLAKKAAAKAAMKAQKEAENKLKEREKKAKKKAAATAPASQPEVLPTEDEAVLVVLEKADDNVEVLMPASKNKEQKENTLRYRDGSKGSSSISRLILKRKKSSYNWLWLAFAAFSVLMLLVVGYSYLL